jgi:hypothetical protein
MSNGDAIKRKIIIDSWVIRTAAAGIKAAANDLLTDQQLEQLARIDERYLDAVRRVAPELVDEYESG